MKREEYREWLGKVSLQREMGRLEWAFEQYEEVIGRASTDGLFEIAAEACQMQGVIRTVQGRLDETLPLLEQALADAARCPEETAVVLRGQVLRDMGICYIHRGDGQAAIPVLEKSFTILQNTWDKNGAAMSQVKLGVAYAVAGRLDEAEATLEKGIRLLGEYGTPYFRASAELSLAKLLYLRRRFRDAIPLALGTLQWTALHGHWTKAQSALAFLARAIFGPLLWRRSYKIT